MEIKVEVTVIIDTEEAYKQKQTPDQLMGSIGFAVEQGLADFVEPGLIRSSTINTRKV